MARRKTIPDERLLECARAVFVEHGASASTKEIARRAGVAEATLFQRFPTKAALFVAAMVPPAVDVEAVADVTGLEDDPRAALERMAVRMLVEFQARIPVVRRLLEHPEIGLADVTRHLGGRGPQAMVRLTGAVAERLRAWQALGAVKPHDALATASLLVSAVHNLVAFEFPGEKPDTIDAALKTYVRAIWSGIAHNAPVKEDGGGKDGQA